jgi:hypothetical protein
LKRSNTMEKGFLDMFRNTNRSVPTIEYLGQWKWDAEYGEQLPHCSLISANGNTLWTRHNVIMPLLAPEQRGW